METTILFLGYVLGFSLRKQLATYSASCGAGLRFGSRKLHLVRIVALCRKSHRVRNHGEFAAVVVLAPFWVGWVSLPGS